MAGEQVLQSSMAVRRRERIDEMKKLRFLLIAFSSSFLISTLIFQVFKEKIDSFSLGGSTSLKSSTEVAELLQKNSKELSCFQDKDGDGKVELSLLNQTQEEKELDCLLLGCNLYEFE